MTTSAADVFRRFQDLHRELDGRRRWFQQGMPFRYAAIALVDAPGAPAQVADRLIAVAERLAERAGWFGALQSALRFVIAAVVVHDGDDADAVHDEVDRVAKELRKLGMWRGRGHEVIGILLLRRARGGKAIRAVDIERFHRVYRMMKQHHPWLTDTNDYGACGLLAAESADVEAMGQRIERFYQQLNEAGLSAGNGLQLASHLLFLHPGSDHEVIQRYLALHKGFREAGVRMWAQDYDELALLTFASLATERLVPVVVGLRQQVGELASVGPVETFSLASSLALLLHPPAVTAGHTARAAHVMIQVQAVLSAQAAGAAAGGGA